MLQLSDGQVADYLNIYYQGVVLVGELVYDPYGVAMASSVSLGSVIISLSLLVTFALCYLKSL